LLTLYNTPLCDLNLIVPVEIAQVGCIGVADKVGANGAMGTVLMVTVLAAAVTQVLSEVLRTFKVKVPGLSPEKVESAWKLTPSFTLYFTPLCDLNLIVPVGMAQVGCIGVVDKEGAIGALGTTLMVNVLTAAVVQEFDNLLTFKV
jgi:hypothetical protein